jgi:hypothetical protein
VADTEHAEEGLRQEGLHRAFTNLANGVVGWDGEDDPQNPM